MPERLKETEVEQGTIQPELVTEECPEARKASADERADPANSGAGEEVSETVIQCLKDENETLQNNYLRLKADLDNIRRRTQMELAEVRQTASEGLISRLLPVLDNLERAVLAGAENEGWKKGVEMVLRQFREVLAEDGLEPIPAVGQIFDPQVHEVVLTEPADAPEGTILLEMQKGYTLNGKVIRFSMVKVAS